MSGQWYARKKPRNRIIRKWLAAPAASQSNPHRAAADENTTLPQTQRGGLHCPLESFMDNMDRMDHPDIHAVHGIKT
jgi:hypothetical protein